MVIGQYTDQDIVVGIKDGSLNGISGIHVTFTQKNTEVDITDVEIISDTEFSVLLSQQHTGEFVDDCPVMMQMNYFNSAGRRKYSNIVYLEVGTNLLRRFIENV